MSRQPHIIPILLLAVLVLGCEGRVPWSEQEQSTTATARTDFGPTAAYDRRMIFLGPGGDLPTAAVVDLQVLSDSAGLRRGARARFLDGQGWIPLLDAGWEMGPMRSPWRLVPHGPMRIRLSEDAELDAIEFRDEPTLRLLPGGVIAEHAPDAGTQLVLRHAALLVEDEPHEGVLLDAQIGRDAGADFRPRTRGGPADDDGSAADGESASPSPTARPGTEALLLDGEDFHLVIAAAARGQIAWVHSAGQDDVRTGVELRGSAQEPFTEAAVQVPTAWQLITGAGAVVGELRAESSDRSVLEGSAASALRYVIVTGWVEDRSVRRQVFGLVRDIR